MGISSRVCLAGARPWNEALLILVYLCLSRSRSSPSLGWPSRPFDHPSDSWAKVGQRKSLFVPYSLSGKRVRSAWEDEPFGAISVGNDRDRWCVSCDVTRRCVVAGLEIEADGCPSRIRRPYKTTGFAPRVPYSIFSPSHRQPPPPIARASYTSTTAAIELAFAS